jgi:hypothetical protein
MLSLQASDLMPVEPGQHFVITASAGVDNSYYWVVLSK